MNKPARIAADHELTEGFSASEFMRMADAGAFTDIPGKIELAEGVIVRMSPANNPHFTHQRQLFIKLHNIFGDGLNGWIVGQEPTVKLAQNTVRDPDIAIMRDPGDSQTINNAVDFLLVAEISDTTFDEDLRGKRLSYARAAIPHYWVVDIRKRRILTMADPVNGDYRTQQEIAFGEEIPVPGCDAVIALD